MKKFSELSIEEQLEYAAAVMGLLASRIHKDYSSDSTGWTIQKSDINKHFQKLTEQIARGDFQPLKVKPPKF